MSVSSDLDLHARAGPMRGLSPHMEQHSDTRSYPCGASTLAMAWTVTGCYRSVIHPRNDARRTRWADSTVDAPEPRVPVCEQSLGYGDFEPDCRFRDRFVGASGGEREEVRLAYSPRETLLGATGGHPRAAFEEPLGQDGHRVVVAEHPADR
jgi:hypothetical protein